MPKFSKNKAVYLDRGWYPQSVVFIPTETAWRRFLQEHKIDKAFPERGFEYPASRGRTSFITMPGDFGGSRYIVVFIGAWADTAHPINVMGVIAHEVQHVLQYLWDAIGEDKRGAEQEAYAAQHFFCQIVQSFMLTRRPKWDLKLAGVETW